MSVIKKTISIGIPCFNEELNVAEAYRQLTKVTIKNKKYNYEFIFVDNGSTDKTRNEIRKIVTEDRRVIGVFLSRNFGPESSLQALLDVSHGDAFIGIPCDLQDPPDLIPEFIKRWEDGYSVVVGVYTKIEDIFFMRIARRSFYRLFKAISNIDVPVNAGGVGLMDKKVVRVLNSLPEKYRFFRGLRSWVGFRTAYITYERRKRERGKSSYSVFNYIRHAERSFFGFSYVPLDFIIYIGLFLVLVSFVFIVVYLLFAIFYSNSIRGSVAILVSIVFFGGVQLLAMSILGKYVQVIVEETKNRPVYIIDEIVSKKNER